jgi:LmbE family N-acetylglucosaminyl deacetylase
MSSISIWAPHPDDEIIGCWSALHLKHRVDDISVIYLSGVGDPGIERSQARFGFRYLYAGYANMEAAGPYSTVLAPDPASDWHPLHQRVGQVAQHMFRDGKIRRLIMYTTRMLAPYVFEVANPAAKRAALNDCYPEKSSLWESDHRFFLFEGYCSWLRPGEI